MSQLIYYADDEKHIRELIEAFLVQEGYEVKTFADGRGILDACKKKMPDLVIVDILMPGVDGLSVCHSLRTMSSELPIIIVSAKDSPYDRVTGFSAGSSDYMVKPFLPLELVFRVKALLRGRQGVQDIENADEDECIFGNLKLFPKKRKAQIDEKEFMLTPGELDFLYYMILRKDRAVSRDELLESIWKMNYQADTRATDDLVKRLRKKLRDNKCNIHIETVWGYGFRLSICEDM